MSMKLDFYKVLEAMDIFGFLVIINKIIHTIKYVSL